MEVSSELQFQILVDPKLPPIVEGAVSFETGASPDLLRMGVYNHHGSGFGPESTGALTRFYEDLVSGAPFPLTLATHAIESSDTVVAIALFMHRELAILPSTIALVAGVDLAHRLGTGFLAHVDQNLAGFLSNFSKLFPKNLSKRERGERLGMAVQCLRDYLLTGVVPSWTPPPQVQVVQVGTNGFVVARSQAPSVEGWVELFRMGYLRGVLVSTESPWSVLIARKHPYSWPDMDRAVTILKQLESFHKGSTNWTLSDWVIASPTSGTLIPIDDILAVLLKV